MNIINGKRNKTLNRNADFIFIRIYQFPFKERSFQKNMNQLFHKDNELTFIIQMFLLFYGIYF